MQHIEVSVENEYLTIKRIDLNTNETFKTVIVEKEEDAEGQMFWGVLVYILNEVNKMPKDLQMIIKNIVVLMEKSKITCLDDLVELPDDLGITVIQIITDVVRRWENIKKMDKRTKNK